MNPDEFEQQLQGQPLRSVPEEWHAQILGAARAEVRSGRAVEAGLPWWRQWLWPCPEAWVGLAAVWMVLLGLQFIPPSTPSSAARQVPSQEKQMALAAQQRELASLLDVPVEPKPVLKSPVPGPRGERPSPPKV